MQHSAAQRWLPAREPLTCPVRQHYDGAMTWLSWTRVVACALVAVLEPPGARVDEVDKLLEGTTTVARVGIPGPVAIFGEKAFPVVAGALDGSVQAAAIACSRLGSGRLVVFGHNGYGGAAQALPGETGLLLRNLLQWAAKSKAKALRVGTVQGAFDGLFREAGFEIVDLPRGAKPGGVDKLALIGCSPLSLRAEEVEWLTAYVSNGGGLLCGDTPWGWMQVTKGGQILAQPGQRLLAQAGLAYADGYLGATASGERFAAARPSDLLNGTRALDLLTAVDQGKLKADARELAQATSSLQLALRWMPEGDFEFRDKLERVVQAREPELVPTPETPLRASDALKRALLAVQLEQLRRADPAKVKAHAAAASFPGDSDARPSVTQVRVDARVPGWHSTGAYARPGARIEVQVPSEMLARGFSVRIGCHSDELWHLDEWQRAPRITNEVEIVERTTYAANAFGGPVYIVVPEGCLLDEQRVQIRGAIAAPLFVLGQTTLDEWRSSIRARPAPWAEIGSSKLVISVPSSAVRLLDDPESLMRFWDRVLDAQAELVGVPTERPRPERFVCDRQISAGYMHSGYPVMMFLDVPELLMSRERLESGEEIWGFVHELGHNLQRPEWTFEGTGEVTNNVIAVYAIERCCTLPPGRRGHDAVNAPPSFEVYAARGAKFEEWKADPFLALSMYLKLREAFGWEPFKQVFREYRALNQDELPRNDDEARDQWLVRLSRAAGRDLGPYFQAWGVPTSERARRSLSDLPAWNAEPAGESR